MRPPAAAQTLTPGRASARPVARVARSDGQLDEVGVEAATDEPPDDEDGHPAPGATATEAHQVPGLAGRAPTGLQGAALGQLPAQRAEVPPDGA